MKTPILCLNLNPAAKLSLFIAPRDDGSLPMEFGPVLKWGRNPSTQGDVFMGDKTRSLFAANQRQLGFDEVALDFEHNTVEGTPAFKESKEPRPVAAYGAYDLRQDGLYFVVRRWTPEGTKNALNYADLSPAVKTDAGKEVVFGHSLALCRQGSVFGVHAFSVDVTDIKTEEELLMDKMMELLRKALGLKADATEQEIVDGMKGMIALTGRLQAAEGTIITLSSNLKLAQDEAGKVKDLAAEIATLKASVLEGEKALACYHARLEGKLITLSADAIKQLDLKTLNETLAKLPAGQVPTIALSAGGTEPAGTSAGLSEQDRKLGRELGFTEEQMKAANNLK